MANEREITIRIAAKNLTAAEFDKAKAQVLGLADAKKKTSAEGKAMASVMTGAVAGAVTAVATKALDLAQALAGRVVDSIGYVIERGGQVAAIGTAFESLAGGAGEADAMLDVLRGSTRGLVTDFDLMGASNKAMLLGLGLNKAEMGDLAKTATILGRAMGQDATKSLDDLIIALGRSSPMILDNLGLSVKVGEANEAYARSLGKTSSELTDAEKKQAFMSAAMEAARAKVAELGDVQLTLTDRLQQASVWWGNTLDQFSVGIAQSPVLAAAMDGIAASFGATFGGDNQVLVQTLIGLVEQGAIVLVDFARMGLTASDTVIQAFYGLRAVLFDALASIVDVETGMRDLAAGALESAAQIPGVGRAFADSAREARQSAEEHRAVGTSLRETAAEAHRAASGQNTLSTAIRALDDALGNARGRMHAAATAQRDQADATERTAAAARTAVPAIEALGTVVDEKAAKAAAKAAAEHQKLLEKFSEYGRVLPQLTGLLENLEKTATDHVSIVTMARHEYAQAAAEAQKWANTMGGVLAPSMVGFSGTVNASMKSSGDSTQGFFSKVFGGAEGLSGSLTSMFQAAFTGGGGALGAVKGFATGALSNMLGMIPGVGQWAQMFAGPIVEMFGKLGGKIKDFFSKIFGKPSRDELNGRNLVHEFEGSIQKTLSAAQKAEAGNESWKMTVIAIRDAYIAAGRTEQEALADAERLWASSKQGAEASREVIAEIEAKMHATGATARAAVEGVTDAINDIPRDVVVNVRGRYEAPEIPGDATGRYRVGTKGVHGTWFPNFSHGQVVQVDPNEAIVPRDRVTEFIRDVTGGQIGPAGGGAPVSVYIVNDTAGARQVTEHEFRQVQQRLADGRLHVPARVVGVR